MYSSFISPVDIVNVSLFLSIQTTNVVNGFAPENANRSTMSVFAELQPSLTVRLDKWEPGCEERCKPLTGHAVGLVCLGCETNSHHSP